MKTNIIGQYEEEKSHQNKEAFNGLVPGKTLNGYDPLKPSAFDKLKALLGISETKYPDKIIREDMIGNCQSP